MKEGPGDASDRYYDLAKGAGFDYAALWQNQQPEVVKTVEEARAAWVKASPLYEQIEGIPYMVVKHDGRREEFSRKKLLQGLLTAAQKRPIPMRKLEAIVDAAEALLHQREDREITTQEIGAFVMDRLKEIDQVAYVRFASVYRRFDDIAEFREVLKNLLHSPPPGERPGEG